MAEDKPATVVYEAVLYHCGQRMMVRCSAVEAGVRTRYWSCRCCGFTDKTVEQAPAQAEGRLGSIARAHKRH